MCAGNEHVAVVEFAPNQKVPSGKENRRKDPKLNSLEQDPEYVRFLEQIQDPQEVQRTREHFTVQYARIFVHLYSTLVNLYTCTLRLIVC